MTEIIEILDSFSTEDPETPVQTPKEKAESLFQFMDVDNSGGITFDEFIKVSYLFILFYLFVVYFYDWNLNKVGKLLLPMDEEEDWWKSVVVKVNVWNEDADHWTKSIGNKSMTALSISEPEDNILHQQRNKEN